MTTLRPPRLAEIIVSAAVPPGPNRAAILGDLLEEFTTLTAHRGDGRARCWYWRQTLQSSVPLVLRRTRRGLARGEVLALGAGLAALVLTFVVFVGSGVFLVNRVGVSPVPSSLVYLLTAFSAAVVGGRVVTWLSRTDPRTPSVVLSVLAAALMAGIFVLSPERESVGMWLVWLPWMMWGVRFGAATRSRAT